MHTCVSRYIMCSPQIFNYFCNSKCLKLSLGKGTRGSARQSHEGDRWSNKGCPPPPPIFVAFVRDNATTSSIPYFENHLRYFVQNLRK